MCFSKTDFSDIQLGGIHWQPTTPEISMWHFLAIKHYIQVGVLKER